MVRCRPVWLEAWWIVLVCGLGCGAAPGGGSAPDAARAPMQGSSVGVAAESATAEQPEVDNLLLITIDTWRWDAAGFQGAAAGLTPTFDRLASSGRVFDRAHAHNVVTLPSHANILTGLYPFQHGIRDNLGFRLPAHLPTAATLLREAGFATAAFVGAFPLDSRFGLDRGFDVYDDEVPEGSHPTEIVPAERRGDEVVERARRWWRRRDGERRFLWVHLFDPHAPYAPPEPWAARFANDPYLGEVAATDAFLAPLLEPFLDGAEPSTLILLTSDHGEALGDHGELTHGLFAYEATLRVPLVLWHPGIEPGRSAEPARHVDLLPTLLEAAGLSAPAALPGRSLLRPLAAVGEAGPPVSYFEALTAALDRGWAPLRGVVADGYKLIDLPVAELYDLRQDPGERRNLFDQEPTRARTLAARLPAESAWPPGRGPVDEETAAALRALGYLGGGASAKKQYTAADDPKNLVELDQRMHRVVDLYSRDQLAAAAAEAKAVVEARPDMGIAYYYWAQTLLQQSALEEAIAVMQRARQRGVATAALTRQLALSLSQVGRAREAVELVRPLARDGDPDALNALGVVLSEAGSHEEARAVLQRVFDRDPRNALAHEHLALVALRLRQWSEAGDQARRALALNEGLTLSWNYLGTALYNLGSVPQALEAWDRALALEPGNLDVLYNVAVVAAEAGDRDRARRALRAFIELAPPERFGADIERARGLLRQLGG